VSTLQELSHRCLGTLAISLAAALSACGSPAAPSQPEVFQAQPSNAAGASAAASNTWTTRASMATGRSFLAAAPANGLVYAVGGINNTGVVTTVEAYNPATNTWTTKAALPAGRAAPNGLTPLNGLLYLPGGSSSSLNTRTLWAYNPTTNRWVKNLALMPVRGRGGASGAINNQLYVYFGEATSGPKTLLRYDPATDAWVTLASAPHRHSYPAAGVIDGKFYLAGGDDGSTPNGTFPTRTLDVYDPATNTWSTKTPMPIGRFHGAGRVINGKLYVAGGSNATTYDLPVVVYDPATNTWATKAKMITPRVDLALAVLSGRLYAVGGSGQPPNGEFLPTNEAYAP
jgi:N-acetylneuraminic acid mutarotase